MRITLGQTESHVIAIKRVRHDELMRIAAIRLFEFHPKRQIVAVIIARIVKPLICYEAQRIRAVTPGVPAASVNTQ